MYSCEEDFPHEVRILRFFFSGKYCVKKISQVNLTENNIEVSCKQVENIVSIQKMHRLCPSSKECI